MHLVNTVPADNYLIFTPLSLIHLLFLFKFATFLHEQKKEIWRELENHHNNTLDHCVLIHVAMSLDTEKENGKIPNVTEDGNLYLIRQPENNSSLSETGLYRCSLNIHRSSMERSPVLLHSKFNISFFYLISLSKGTRKHIWLTNWFDLNWLLIHKLIILVSNP